MLVFKAISNGSFRLNSYYAFNAIARWLLIGGGVLLHLPTQGYSQRDYRIDGTPVCKTCVITASTVAVIYDSSGVAGLSSEPLSIVRGPGGSIYLATNRFEPMWFQSNGKFGGTLGREGDGPGEYRRVRTVFIGGDTVYTHDSRLARRSAWTKSGAFVNSGPSIPYAFDVAVQRDDGTMVISQPLSTRDMIGFPFHRFDREGKWIESFGAGGVIENSEDMRKLKRLITEGPGGSFWSSHKFAYVLEQIGPNGQVLQRMSRGAEWFPYTSEIIAPNSRVPFSATVRSLKFDNQTGYVWVLINTPGREWRAGVGEPEDYMNTGLLHVPITDYKRAYRSIIEVVDPASRRVVVSEQFDAYLFSFVDARHVAAYREDEMGVPVIEILEVMLQNSINLRR